MLGLLLIRVVNLGDTTDVAARRLGFFGGVGVFVHSIMASELAIRSKNELRFYCFKSFYCLELLGFLILH